MFRPGAGKMCGNKWNCLVQKFVAIVFITLASTPSPRRATPLSLAKKLFNTLTLTLQIFDGKVVWNEAQTCFTFCHYVFFSLPLCLRLSLAACSPVCSFSRFYEVSIMWVKSPSVNAIFLSSHFSNECVKLFKNEEIRIRADSKHCRWFFKHSDLILWYFFLLISVCRMRIRFAADLIHLLPRLNCRPISIFPWNSLYWIGHIFIHCKIHCSAKIYRRFYRADTQEYAHSLTHSNTHTILAWCVHIAHI